MSFWKFAALSTVAVLAGCAATPATVTGSAAPSPVASFAPAVDGGSVARGAAMVQSRCSSCHAVGRAGDSPLAAAPRFRELSQKYPVSSLQEAFAEGLVTAHPEMPEFVLEPTQISDLIAYLESVNGPVRAAPY